MENETVVLVHGLWTNGLDMGLLKQRLQRQGYRVSRFRYHSLTRTPGENARVLEEFLKQVDAPVVHFVCHSLGGLVIRHLFYAYPGQKPGKVVTLGTPHKPSYTAYRILRLPFGPLILGKSIEDGLMGNVPKWNGSHDLGSIAGTLRLGMGMLVPGAPLPNDGTVSVEETYLDNMKDHAVIKTSHFGLLLSRRTAVLIIDFLKNGRFGSI
jgi:pimeloyl-ACP methyl ester carboxylesterase